MEVLYPLCGYNTSFLRFGTGARLGAIFEVADNGGLFDDPDFFALADLVALPLQQLLLLEQVAEVPCGNIVLEGSFVS